MLGDLGKLIVAKGFKKLPKVQSIARSGHTAYDQCDKIILNTWPFFTIDTCRRAHTFFVKVGAKFCLILKNPKITAKDF